MRRTLTFILSGVVAIVTAGCQFAPAFNGGANRAHAEIGGEDNRSIALPQDGARVRYRVDHDVTSEKVAGGDRFQFDAKFSGGYGNRWSDTITLSFVGRTVEKHEPCRWIEVKTERPADDGPKTYISKMLVTEKALLESSKPLARKNVLRIWKMGPDGTVHQAKSPPSFPLLFSWTPGCMKKFECTGEQCDFEYPAGQLESATNWKGRWSNHDRALLGLARVQAESEQSVWVHPGLPAGFASMRCSTTSYMSFLTAKGKTVQVTEFHLEDAGTNALSELPDYN